MEPGTRRQNAVSKGASTRPTPLFENRFALQATETGVHQNWISPPLIPSAALARAESFQPVVKAVLSSPAFSIIFRALWICPASIFNSRCGRASNSSSPIARRSAQT